MFLKKKEGFSLIEVVISITILGILLLTIPHLMINAENLKRKYETEISVDKAAMKILDKATASNIIIKKDIQIENNIKYSIEKEIYNENINKYVFTFMKNSHIKKYYLLKPKE